MSNKLNQFLKFQFTRNRFASRNIPLTQFGTQPILEGQYPVGKPQSVPSHIIPPDYVNNKNPVFGVYEGKPVLHDQQSQERMRSIGKIAGQVLTYIGDHVKEGVTTDELDKLIHDFIISKDAYPTPQGFMHFPKSVCSSVNEVLCHGIPDSRPLQNGDFINLDVTVFKDGVHGDNSAMYMVGQVDEQVQKLISVTQQALYESIKICKPGVPFKNIGQICQEIALSNGFINCELFTGHGVGEKLHMPPIIHHQKNDYPFIMEPGNVFTIEPIFMMRPGQYYMWKDNFTVLCPNVPSAQWEHLILITDTGYEVLTQRENEIIS